MSSLADGQQRLSECFIKKFALKHLQEENHSNCIAFHDGRTTKGLARHD
jgi:uncharacterized protein with ParB-like and HNH nuclease domain